MTGTTVQKRNRSAGNQTRHGNRDDGR